MLTILKVILWWVDDKQVVELQQLILAHKFLS